MMDYHCFWWAYSQLQYIVSIHDMGYLWPMAGIMRYFVIYIYIFGNIWLGYFMGYLHPGLWDIFLWVLYLYRVSYWWFLGPDTYDVDILWWFGVVARISIVGVMAYWYMSLLFLFAIFRVVYMYSMGYL